MRREEILLCICWPRIANTYYIFSNVCFLSHGVESLSPLRSNWGKVVLFFFSLILSCNYFFGIEIVQHVVVLGLSQVWVTISTMITSLETFRCTSICSVIWKWIFRLCCWCRNVGAYQAVLHDSEMCPILCLLVCLFFKTVTWCGIR